MSNIMTSEGQGETTQPSWIDTALIQQALRNGGEENSQVAAISVTRAVADGENYVSTVYRVKTTLSDGGERSFIVKGPATGGWSEVAKESRVFQREITMLTDCIPKMESLLEEAAPGRFPPLAPRCFHHGTSPVEFLVLEDLTPSGFKMADRRSGLGLRHSLLALRTLARFHAASYALLEQQSEFMGKLDTNMKSDTEGLQEYFNGNMEALAIAFRSWPGFEECAKRLEKFKSTSGEVYDKLNKPKPGDFNVIAHGDFWVNNMMYLYRDGNPAEFRVIDLQLAHASSAAIDILQFLVSSLSEDVYEHHQDLLLREYHVELKATLELLGQQAPSLDSLLSAVDAHGSYSLFMIMEFPVVMADRGADMEAISKGDYRELLQLLELPHIKKRIQRILQEYVRKGWLPA